ncbi:hypothetical protein LEN26_013281 [Aphanomyces euteiches]|nr:hypothetical protein LEN26_013281 [Aphanomyces euteiches]KAH9113333.1 hypothetical protein AeMF1_012441 [Aphanomyces euteiches]KAH9188812.1 hypothetical protein AeNC1_009220 [Aphanomyces euteiches]
MSGKVREAACVVVFNHLEQILFVKRPKTSKAWANVMVFPGGKVDASDDNGHPSPLPHVPIRFLNAAIRELFEEVDIGLTTPSLYGHLTQEERRQWRKKIVQGETCFDEFSRSLQCTLCHEALVPFHQVTTPVGSPHRFDTWFFLTQISQAAAAQVETDGLELEELLWLTPKVALDGYAAGNFMFATPQFYLLHHLRQFDSWNHLVSTAKAQAKTPQPSVLPQRIPPSAEFPGTLTAFPGDPLYEPRIAFPFLHRVYLHPTDPAKSSVHLPPVLPSRVK